MLIMTISPSTSAARTLGLRAIRVVSPIPAGLSPDADAELPFGELLIGNASAFRAAGFAADYDRCRHLAFGASCAVAVHDAKFHKRERFFKFFNSNQKSLTIGRADITPHFDGTGRDTGKVGKGAARIS